MMEIHRPATSPTHTLSVGEVAGPNWLLLLLILGTVLLVVNQ